MTNPNHKKHVTYKIFLQNIFPMEHLQNFELHSLFQHEDNNEI